MNDPVNAVDPEGKAAVLPALIVVGAGAAAIKGVYDYCTDPLLKMEVDMTIDILLNNPQPPAPRTPRPAPPQYPYSRPTKGNA